MHIFLSEEAIRLDNALLQIKEGDNSGLRTIFDTAGKQIFVLALSILRSRADAEDVMQDTLIKIAENIHTYKSGTKAKAWIFCIGRNLALDCLRKKSRSAASDGEAELENIIGDENVDAEISLSESLSCLSQDERQIVSLHIFSGFRHKEIASVMDMSEGAVKMKYKRSLEKLKTYYSGDAASYVERTMHEKN